MNGGLDYLTLWGSVPHSYCYVIVYAGYLVHSLDYTAGGHIAGGWTKGAWYVLIVDEAVHAWVEHYTREQWAGGLEAGMICPLGRGQTAYATRSARPPGAS